MQFPGTSNGLGRVTTPKSEETDMGSQDWNAGADHGELPPWGKQSPLIKRQAVRGKPARGRPVEHMPQPHSWLSLTSPSRAHQWEVRAQGTHARHTGCFCGREGNTEKSRKQIYMVTWKLSSARSMRKFIYILPIQLGLSSGCYNKIPQTG